MFQTRENWEYTLGCIGVENRKGIRQYHLFEVSLDVHLFHVETREKGKKRKEWSRYIFVDLIDILPLLMRKTLEVRISVQSRQRDTNNGDYEISTVIEIQEARDHYDQPAHLYKCKNGKVYIRSLVADNEDDLIEKKSIYSLRQME